MAGTSITVPLDGGAALDGDLEVPPGAVGLVAFAHGSGSSRTSPRNRFVAERLQASGLATLLIDLLTVDEEAVDRRSAQHRFDIGLLADRLGHIVDWTDRQEALAPLPVGLFGASTGAAASLVAAAHRARRIAAVVSRGGRPDLAGDALSAVTAPTMLIVGGRDPQVLELNRSAAEALTGEWRLEVVPGATHLFEEPGTLERVADLAGEWFLGHLTAATNASS